VNPENECKTFAYLSPVKGDPYKTDSEAPQYLRHGGTCIFHSLRMQSFY
jgi:hypothetical protein